ncbi:response regulator [candidate division KSB1 bacterium]|nr:response regulator [candidate division KSB1 bacterium]
MKIIILNGELRSGMQIYLALSNFYEVEVALDVNDLMRLLESENTDYTFLDLDEEDSNCVDPGNYKIVDKILKKYPKTKVVGICDHVNPNMKEQISLHGINKVLTKPIKNRELYETIKAG